MDEGDRSMEQLVELQQNSQPPAGDFPSSVLSASAREGGMSCPRCQSQNATSFTCWTLSGRKMTLPQVRMWACLDLTCRHQWLRKPEDVA
jgi:hypothetical protein